jgi:hypothetical protein
MKYEARIECSDELKPLIGTQVGLVKINKSWVHRNQYECAAWYEDREIVLGTYPLTLEVSRHSPKALQLACKLDAVVVDDYFPSLWGGVPINRKPYIPKGIGEKRKVHHKFELINAIARTGDYPGAHDVDFMINPFIWWSVARAAEKTMGKYYEYLNRNWQDRQEEEDDHYLFRLNAIAHAGTNIDALSKAIQEISTRLRDIREATQYGYENCARNTAWAFK